MRVNDDGEKLASQSVTQNEEEVQKYDPTQDRLAQIFAMLLHCNYASSNPEVSIAARILSRLHRQPISNPNKCPMMAVTVRNYRYSLLYNPKWVHESSYNEIVATLVHEAYHVMLRDIPRFLKRMALFPPEERGSAHHILNVALDAANNDLIKDRMPHMKYGSTGYWVLPSNTDLKPNRSSEHYFEVLLERARQNQRDMEDAIQQIKNDPNAGEKEKKMADAAEKLMNQNAHDWRQGSKKGGEDEDGEDVPMSPEELEAAAAQLDEEAKKHTASAMKDHQKRHGKLPSHLQKVLDGILEEGEIHWTVYLRQLVAARVSPTRRKTPNRFHKTQFLFAEEDEEGRIQAKEFPSPLFPGIEVDRTFVIQWALDTSGSMSEDDIMDGLSELQGLMRADPNIHVIITQCDTTISDVSLLGPEDDLEQYIKDVGRTSMGGTDFNPPFELVRYIKGLRDVPPVNDNIKEKTAQTLHEYDTVDMVVYHTDGEAPAPDISRKPDCPVLWCLAKHRSSTPGYGNGELFGQVIER